MLIKNILSSIYNYIHLSVVVLFYQTFFREVVFAIEAIRYYRFPAILKMDLLWQWTYFFHSPFRISRQDCAREKLSKYLTVYGETSLLAFEHILQQVSASPNDTLYEMGSGTGRALLFANLRFQMNAVGYEVIPTFVDKTKQLIKRLRLEESVSIYQQNWFQADLSKGTIFFVVGTCYSDSEVEVMKAKLREVPSGAHVITVSFPLEVDYLKRIDKQSYFFSWGRDIVYFHLRK